jgi:holo-[acyl-carrier protein] synthase
MIVGIGLDVAEIDRIEQAIERHGDAFKRRVYTDAECAYCESHKRSGERFAARFAAKEAGMKALGTGWRGGITWHDFEVVRQLGGKPTLRLSGVAQRLAEKLGVNNIVMTITHSGNLAVAQVIFEG